MKKLGKILSLVVILTVVLSMSCFAAFADTEATSDNASDGAGKLVLTDTYPKDGATGTAIENMGVKLYFDSTFTQSKLKDANADAVKLYDPDGNVLPTQVLYSTQEPGVVLVLFDKNNAGDATIQQKTEYTFKLSGDFTDDAGNTLGTEQTVSFTTLNQNANMWINMGMMAVMFGGMMIMTAKSAKKQVEEERKKREDKVNPYKEAKKTGKSVEEIVEKDQKDKAKRAEKAAKKAAALGELDDDDDYYDDGNYHVKAPRPISAAGGKYKTGRKALYEAKLAEEEQKRIWAEKAKKGKGKGKKKK